MMENLTQAKHCHLIFVGVRNAEKLLSNWNNQYSLLVGDSDIVTEKGGVIEFVVIDQKVRFNINLARAQQLGLKINAHLLELAVTVNSKKLN